MIKYRKELNKALKENNLQEVKNIFILSMKEKIRQGWKVVQKKTYDSDNKECCAVGSLIKNKWSDGLRDNFSYENFNKISDIVNGFDYPDKIYLHHISCEDWILLGKDLFKWVEQNSI